MKRIIFLIAALSNSLSWAIGPKIVQRATLDGTASPTTTLAYTVNNTKGNLLIAVTRVGNAGTTLALTDTPGNTWKQALGIDNAVGGRMLFLHYVENCLPGANTITFTAGTTSSVRIAIYEYSGIFTNGALDKAVGATGNSATSDSGLVQTTYPYELAVGAAERSGGVTFTAGSGWTMQDQVPAAPTAFLGVEDRILTQFGSYNATETFTAADWTAVIATFRVLRPALPGVQ